MIAFLLMFLTRNVAVILSLSALSKNLTNFPGMVELDPCDNVDKEYEECKSTTPTSYDAKHCEKIRKTKASCLEQYKESLQKKATAAGFDRPIDYLWHEREKDPQYCRISYEMYKKGITRNVAVILSLSALSKNLTNFPGMVELDPCDNVDKEYEECNSTTPTSYDAKRCEKIRKTKASCVERNRQLLNRKDGSSLVIWLVKSCKEMLMVMHEGFMKDDLDEEDFCDDGGGIQSILGEDVDEGYFGGCQTLAKFGDYGESDDFLDESLDGDDHNKDSISALVLKDGNNVEREYEESLQKKATAAGFDRPIDYVRHKREKNPRYCRISYEKYKK
ncbi:unnamed protein product [Camellia sinensis]